MTQTATKCSVCGKHQSHEGRIMRWLAGPSRWHACWGWKCEKWLCPACQHGEERMCWECYVAEGTRRLEHCRKEHAAARELRELPERVAVLEYRMGELEKAKE